jgi:tetratricopeptide (TPR) repeat protein
MKMTTWSKVAALLVAGGLLMVGCSKAATPTTPPAAAEQNQRPPLSIPAQFESEQAELDFVAKALSESYYEEVAPLLTDLLKKNPGNATVHAYMGTTQYMLNRHSEAAEAWSKAAELDLSKAAEMQNNIGNVLRDQKKLEEAKVAYSRALEMDPQLTFAAMNLADLLKGEGKLEEAVAVLDSAISLNPGDPSLLAMARTYKNAVTETD